MKTGFYPKFALDGIRKNKQLYVPYILTCIGMVMMYYIILFLKNTETIDYEHGSGTIRMVLGLGGVVISIFSAIFLFYTNSFLIRRRKKEFGLYNILGMNKWNIGRILLWESVIIAVISLITGLALGIVFSKLAELTFKNILKVETTYELSVSFESVKLSAIVFMIIFALLFLNSLRQIKFSNAINLLRSENTGEKPPKANYIIGISGFIILAGAYYIAVTTQNPVAAIFIFFIAVLMVIFGTYLIFIAGSVLLCKLLQKNKNYYYKSNHFVSVSSMAYRMKRNGAGLASICILATMVLVMLSSTTSLYFGAEDAIKSIYPKEINMYLRSQNINFIDDENISLLKNKIVEICTKYNTNIQNNYEYRYAVITGSVQNDVIETDAGVVNNSVNAFNSFDHVCDFYFIQLDDYNHIMNTNETLELDEVYIYTNKIDYKYDNIIFNGGNSYKVMKHVDRFISNDDGVMNYVPNMFIVVKDFDDGLGNLVNLKDYNDNQMVSYRWKYEFDTGLESDEQIVLSHDIYNSLKDYLSINYDNLRFDCDSREENRGDFFDSYASIFFLGILLSIVFILAAVLIIYYKQISEGYEDQARFDIMQKVGMTKKEIRKSINSQLLTVFFLPLLFAGMHLIFAFPIIRKLLLVLNLNNVKLYAITTIISFLIFALFYTCVYRITSNVYFNIVSGTKSNEKN